MKRLTIIPALLVLVSCQAAHAQKLTHTMKLKFEGLAADSQVTALGQTLGKVEGAIVKVHPTILKPTAILEFDPLKVDVGDVARAVAGNPDTGRPTTFLLLPVYEEGKEDKTGEIEPKAIIALRKVTGVHAGSAKYNATDDELAVRLDEAGGASLNSIGAELEKAGIFVKGRAGFFTFYTGLGMERIGTSSF